MLCVSGPDPAVARRARRPARCWSAALDPFGERERIDGLCRRPGSRRWRWNGCRASPARSRWTSCRRQSNLAGYKAVVDAAAEYGRAFPMMMTAAGTVSAGAGCSSWASASPGCRRSPPRGGWARRSARPTCARRPRSRSSRSAPSRSSSRMSPGIEGEGAGGYATEMSDEYQKAQAELVSGAHRQAGHRHHHRADPRPARAAADLATRSSRRCGRAA